MSYRVLTALLLGLFLATGPFAPALSATDGAQAGRPLIVSTVERPPFTFFENGQPARGFSIELWQEIASRIGRDYRYQPAASFSDMLQQVRDRRADLAVANISITAEREQYLDFSLPIYDSGLKVMIRAENGQPSLLQLFWESGAVQLIVGATLILLVIAHLMWWFEGGKQPYFRKEWPGGVWDAFWWAFIIVTMGGFELERPRGRFSRVLAVFWIIVGLFFISTFTAKITTALTVGELSTSISGWQDLKNRKVGVPRGTTMERFALKHGLNTVTFDDFQQALKALENGKVFAILADAPVAEYYATQVSNGEVVTVGETFAPDKIGIALQDQSPLREPINRALLQIIEDGTYAEIRQRYFGN
jgi:polar amino acid transport system substrate-binding protein